MKQTLGEVVLAGLLVLSSSSTEAADKAELVLSGFSDRLQVAVFSVTGNRNISVSAGEQVLETTWFVDSVAGELVLLVKQDREFGSSHVGLILRRGETLPEASEVEVKEPIRYFIEGSVSEMVEIEGQIQIDQKSGNDQ